MNFLKDVSRSTDLWTIYGSFGYMNTEIEKSKNKATATVNGCSVSLSEATDEYGVVSRTGEIKNVSEQEICVNTVLSKFVLDGGEYEVYTQYNGWQNESLGGWQTLVSGVAIGTDGIRTAYGAAPFMVLWNEQTGRGVAFHLLADSSWCMKVHRQPVGGEGNQVEVEIGINPQNYQLTLQPGEAQKMPEIIYYDVENKLDLDCYKLHNYLNHRFQKPQMPVIYNTWLGLFDQISYESVAEQVVRASKLGAEYFVIDAGWFGLNGAWSDTRGDWVENQTGAFCGRMREVSDLVRKNGMNFGFWLEIESANDGATLLKEHPEFYLTGVQAYEGLNFYDFSKPEACQYMLDVVRGLIRKYDAKFIKFDFNQDIRFDVLQSGFAKYLEGYHGVLKTLRKEFPDLYMQCCASGGLRMTLSELRYYDSFWFSDQQSPYVGMRIFKDSLRRFPANRFEKWATIQSASDFSPIYYGGNPEKIIATHDACWDNIIGVQESYLKGFLTGCPIGISSNLTQFSDALMEKLSEHIAQFKKDRSFYQNAVVRILTDTETMLVLEFSDMASERAEILVFSQQIRQNRIRVYPKLDEKKAYRLGDSIISGKELMTEGVPVEVPNSYRMMQLSFVAE